MVCFCAVFNFAVIDGEKAKAPRVTRGFLDTKRRLRNISMVVRVQAECKRTLVSSDPRRARELNPSWLQNHSTFRRRRPVPTGNTLLNGCLPQ